MSSQETLGTALPMTAIQLQLQMEQKRDEDAAKEALARAEAEAAHKQDIQDQHRYAAIHLTLHSVPVYTATFALETRQSAKALGCLRVPVCRYACVS